MPYGTVLTPLVRSGKPHVQGNHGRTLGEGFASGNHPLEEGSCLFQTAYDDFMGNISGTITVDSPLTMPMLLLHSMSTRVTTTVTHIHNCLTVVCC